MLQQTSAHSSPLIQKDETPGLLGGESETSRFGSPYHQIHSLPTSSYQSSERKLMNNHHNYHQNPHRKEEDALNLLPHHRSSLLSSSDSPSSQPSKFQSKIQLQMNSNNSSSPTSPILSFIRSPHLIASSLMKEEEEDDLLLSKKKKWQEGRMMEEEFFYSQKLLSLTPPSSSFLSGKGNTSGFSKFLGRLSGGGLNKASSSSSPTEVLLELDTHSLREREVVSLNSSPANQEGGRILEKISVEGLNFALTSVGKRYQFTVKGRSLMGRNTGDDDERIERVYEVTSNQDLNTWYKVLSKAKGLLSSQKLIESLSSLNPTPPSLQRKVIPIEGRGGKVGSPFSLKEREAFQAMRRHYFNKEGEEDLETEKPLLGQERRTEVVEDQVNLIKTISTPLSSPSKVTTHSQEPLSESSLASPPTASQSTLFWKDFHRLVLTARMNVRSEIEVMEREILRLEEEEEEDFFDEE